MPRFLAGLALGVMAGATSLALAQGGPSNVLLRAGQFVEVFCTAAPEGTDLNQTPPTALMVQRMDVGNVSRQRLTCFGRP